MAIVSSLENGQVLRWNDRSGLRCSVALVVLASVTLGGPVARAAGEAEQHVVGHWRFDETGVVARDSGPLKNEAKLENARRAAGPSGKALYLDGNGFGVVPPAANLDITGPITIEACVRLDRRPADFASVLTKGGNPNAYRLLIDSAGRWSFRLGGAILNSPEPLKLRTWRYVAGVYDGRQMRLYIDGFQIARRALSESTPKNTRGVYLGKFGPSECYWTGALDEVRLLSRALGPEEVAARYRQFQPGLARLNTIEEIKAQERRREAIVDVVLPPEAVNVAAAANGAKATASSTDEGSSPEKAIDGEKLPCGDSGCVNGWQDATPKKYPDWLEIQLGKTSPIDTVVVTTIPPYTRDRNRAGVRDFDVMAPDGTGWRCVASCRDNVDGKIVCRFPEIRTNALRIVVAATNAVPNENVGGGDRSRILEVEAYQLGKAELIRRSQAVRAVKLAPRSKNGNIAVFRDRVPVQKDAAYSSAEQIGKTLTEAGYGVTYLSAADLMFGEMLTPENFDLLIAPYGPCFPVNTQLLDYLERGGSLFTTGGYALTNLLVLDSADRLVATGYDPGLATTPARVRHHSRYGYFTPTREQIGVFASPFFDLLRVDSVRANPAQHVTTRNLTMAAPLRGLSASARLAEVFPLFEEAKWMEQGREPEYVYRARFNLLGIGGIDAHHDLTFARTCRRSYPLLECFDRYGRKRGEAGAMVRSYGGLYRGSTWVFFGVTDRDMFAPNQPAMKDMLLDVVAHVVARLPMIDTTMTKYACYRQGETVDAFCFVDNFAARKETVQVRFTLTADGQAEPAFAATRNVVVSPKGWKRVGASWSPGRFESDFYTLRAALLKEGKEIDAQESAFVVWSPEVVSRGPKLRLENNYFTLGEEPFMMIGARSEGMHAPGQIGEEPLKWRQEFRMHRDCGLSAASPSMFSCFVPCIGGGGWAEPEEPLIPEELLRQCDAQAQLCQQAGVFYAPNVFFERPHPPIYQRPNAVRASNLVCKRLGERYKDVAGIGFYIWDDAGLRTKKQTDDWAEWSRQCIETGFNANSAGRKHIVFAELKRAWEMVNRQATKYCTLADASRNQRLADMRAAGKSCSVGEFCCELAYGRPHEHATYLSVPHKTFGLGYAMLHVWRWKDSEFTTFSPFGLVRPGGEVPKDLLYTYRNESIFLQSFKPRYEPARVMLVLPQCLVGGPDYRSHKQEQFLLDASSAMRRTLGNDWGVIDDTDLDKLSDATKALVYPRPLCPTEATWQALCKFVARGGALLLSGDVRYAPDGRLAKPDRLKQLLGDAAGEIAFQTSPEMVRLATAWPESSDKADKSRHQPTGADLQGAEVEQATSDKKGPDSPGRKAAVLRAAFGRGRVMFTPDLRDRALGPVLPSFVKWVGIEDRVKLRPASGKVRVSRLPLENGTAFVLTARRPKEPEEVTIHAVNPPVTVTIPPYGVAMVVVDGQDRVTAAEGVKIVQGGRTILDSDVHVMVRSLDGKPITQSEGLLVLPILPVGKGRIAIGSNHTGLAAIVGEVVGGKWRTYEEVSCGPETPDMVALNIDELQATGLICLGKKSTLSRHLPRLVYFVTKGW